MVDEIRFSKGVKIAMEAASDGQATRSSYILKNVLNAFMKICEADPKKNNSGVPESWNQYKVMFFELIRDSKAITNFQPSGEKSYRHILKGQNINEDEFEEFKKDVNAYLGETMLKSLPNIYAIEDIDELMAKIRKYDVAFHSATGHIDSWQGHVNANKEGKWIVGRGPWVGDDSYARVFAISDMMKKENVSVSLSLGNYGKDFAPFVEYDKKHPPQYVTDQFGNVIGVSYKQADKTRYAFQIRLEDVTPLNLDYNGLQAFLAIKALATQESPAYIHCMAGLGRTGMAKLIFTSLENEEIVQCVDRILDNQNKLPTEAYKSLGEKINDQLSAIRRVHFSVQSKQQLEVAVNQIILLRQLEKLNACRPEKTEKDIKRAIDALREKLPLVERGPDETTNIFVGDGGSAPLSFGRVVTAKG
jgi:hypothetical protein